VAGGGFYVADVAAPTLQFAKRSLKHLHSRGSGMLARLRNGDGSYWDGDNMRGSPSMRISLSEQKVYFYKGGQLAGVSPISSGREGYATTRGKFSVIEKDIDHKSSVYGWYVGPDGEVLNDDVDIRKDPKPPGAKFDGANMRYFMRIVGGIGMHEGYLPGYADSHGCIRLPGHMAEKFYHAARVGTPVEIVR
jgi:lipoprotein-anchoring transpeptidase ErfK/SrfK